MLRAADVAGYDLPSLEQRLTDAALHQDRCRRQAARFELPPGFDGTADAIEEMDMHAASIAEGARFVALVARFFRDESSGRPAAPVIRLVRSAEPQTAPAAPAPRVG